MMAFIVGALCGVVVTMLAVMTIPDGWLDTK